MKEKQQEKKMKILLKIVFVIMLSLVLLLAPRIGGWVADLFSYQSIDPDQSFMWISIHHIVQAVVIMGLIIVFVKTTNINFNLGLGNQKEGMSYVKKFMMVFLGYAIIAYTITILTNSFGAFQYPLNARNITGYLGFQLLLSGPSEELIFRAFSISIFTYFITHKKLNKHLSYAVLFSAIIFGVAHIQFSFAPFSVSYSLFQVGYAIVLGYFYGDCYEKSKSVIYPMIMHSFTNVVMVGFTIILSFII
jgi:uncharacterized protein